MNDIKGRSDLPNTQSVSTQVIMNARIEFSIAAWTALLLLGTTALAQTACSGQAALPTGSGPKATPDTVVRLVHHREVIYTDMTPGGILQPPSHQQCSRQRTNPERLHSSLHQSSSDLQCRRLSRLFYPRRLQCDRMLSSVRHQ